MSDLLHQCIVHNCAAFLIVGEKEGGVQVFVLLWLKVALAAFVWFFSCVSEHVGLQIYSFSEGFHASCASVQLYSSVRQIMLSQRSRLGG